MNKSAAASLSTCNKGRSFLRLSASALFLHRLRKAFKMQMKKVTRE